MALPTALVSGLRALSLSAAPRPALLRFASSAAASASSAPLEIPANLVFADEKPVRAPRVVPAAQQGAFGLLFPSGFPPALLVALLTDVQSPCSTAATCRSTCCRCRARTSWSP